MTRIIEISHQYNDGLITAIEFRNLIILELTKIEDEAPLGLLCSLLLRTLP